MLTAELHRGPKVHPSATSNY